MESPPTANLCPTIPDEVQVIIQEARALTIATPAAYEEAGRVLVRVRRAYREIECHLKTLLKPYQERIKDLRSEADVSLILLENADTTLERGILDFEKRQAEAAAAKNAKAVEKWEKKCEQTADAGAGEIPYPPPALALPATPKVDGLGFSKHASWNIPNVIFAGKPVPDADLSRGNPALAAIEDQFWVLDTVKIGRVIRAGGSVTGVIKETIKSTTVQ